MGAWFAEGSADEGIVSGYLSTSSETWWHSSVGNRVGSGFFCTPHDATTHMKALTKPFSAADVPRAWHGEPRPSQEPGTGQSFLTFLLSRSGLPPQQQQRRVLV